MERKAEMVPQAPINKAVAALEKAVNNSLVTCLNIEEAFLHVHPYLLNQITWGVLKAVQGREGDGRICSTLARAAEEVWK